MVLSGLGYQVILLLRLLLIGEFVHLCSVEASFSARKLYHDADCGNKGERDGIPLFHLPSAKPPHPDLVMKARRGPIRRRGRQLDSGPTFTSPASRTGPGPVIISFLSGAHLMQLPFFSPLTGQQGSSGQGGQRGALDEGLG
ncbi:hypothetical protein ACOMHN_032836 [Nucella lapillus]